MTRNNPNPTPAPVTDAEPQRQACVNCQFWKLTDSDDVATPVYRGDEIPGACRRFPPMPAPDATADQLEGLGWWLFPRSYPSDWCGEWQPAAKPTLEVSNDFWETTT